MVEDSFLQILVLVAAAITVGLDLREIRTVCVDGQLMLPVVVKVLNEYVKDVEGVELTAAERTVPGYHV